MLFRSANSNKVKYNTEYYESAVSGSAYPWCVTFVWWLFRELGASALFYDGGKTASSSTLFNHHKNKGQAVTSYKPGDIIYFLFDGSGHTAVCEKFDGVNITTIDGNTGTTNEANGGAVMRRKRHKQYIKGAWRPKYGTSTKPKEEDEMLSYEQFKDYMGQFQTEQAKKEQSTWSAEQGTWSAAQDGGLLDGTRPQSNVTREELAAALMRMNGMGQPEPSEWAKDAWNKATADGILDGTRPLNPVTRQELALVITRLMEGE